MKPLHALPLLLLAAIQDANAIATGNPDSRTMLQGTGSITVDVLANDTTTITNGDLFIQTFDSVSAGYGSVVLNQDNTLTYTPPSENFTGTDTFTYFVRDDSGYGNQTVVTIEVIADVGEPISIDTFVTGARNRSVATMLGTACNAEGASDQLTSSCSQFSSQVGEDNNLDSLVANIAPDEALIQRSLMSENNRNKTSRLYQSISQIQSGSPASLSINNRSLPSGGGTGGAAGDGFSSPWTLLTSIQTEHFEHDQTSKEAGYESKSVGALFGLGYRVDRKLSLGVAFDWSSYEVDFASKGGNMDSDIYSLTGFLSYYSGPIHWDLQAGYASGDTQAKRVFDFPAPAIANSDYGSDQLSLSTQLEWAWQPGAWSLKPFARLDYLQTNVDAFSETGDSVWNMSAGKQKYALLNSSLGFDTSYTATTSWGVVIPGIRFSAINQNDLDSDAVNFQLIDAGSLGNFKLSTDSPDSRFYEWSLNTAFILKNGVSTFISGRVVSDYDNASAYQIAGGINWEF
jgi:outer membrane lipase/esterase